MPKPGNTKCKKHLILEMAADKPSHPPLWRQSSFGGVCFFFYHGKLRANLLYAEVGGGATIFEGLVGSLSLERQ